MRPAYTPKVLTTAILHYFAYFVYYKWILKLNYRC